MSLPCLSPAGRGFGVPMTLVETPTLLASGCKTTHLTVLVHGIDDPIDPGVAANSLVFGVDEDHLKVLVDTILVDPVAVQNTQIGAATSDALFGSGFERPLVFELVDTLVGRFACHGD